MAAQPARSRTRSGSGVTNRCQHRRSRKVGRPHLAGPRGLRATPCAPRLKGQYWALTHIDEFCGRACGSPTRESAPHCRRRIFAERFGDDVLPTRSRRTARLECIVHHLGLALGGRPAASFAQRFMLPVSNDPLLRVVRRRSCPRTEPLTVAGIDDWAFRKNHRYGTIVCDLERRRIVTLLPDREIATVQAWLAGHPDIKVLSRDRGGGYGEAASKALPVALQVADPRAL